MSAGRWTAVVLLVALALGAGFWVLRHDDGADDGARGPGRGVVAPAGAGAGAGDAALRFEGAAGHGAPAAVSMPLAEAAAETAADAALAPAHLAGRVLRAADDTPVAGILVELFDDEAARGAPLASGVSAADGRFALDVEPGRVVAVLVAHDGPETTAARAALGLRLNAGETRRQDLRVGSGGELSGWVVDEAGVPVPGAEVVGWNLSPWALGNAAGNAAGNGADIAANIAPMRRTRASAAGEFTLRALGPVFTLSASADGLAAHKLLTGRLADGDAVGGAGWAGGSGGPATAGAADPASPAALTIVLAPARTIRGRVVDAAGRPVVGASVHLQLSWNLLDPSLTAARDISRAPPPPHDLITDPDGRFALPDCCALAYELRVSHAAHVPWQADVPADAGDLLVTLDDGASISGSVTSAVTGAALVGASVRVLGGRGDGTTVSGGSAETDATGSFSISGLLTTTHGVVAVLAQGHAVQVIENVAVAARDNLPLHVALEVEHVLAGIVVDAAGAPVPDAQLGIVGDRLITSDAERSYPPATWEWRFFKLNRAVSDAQGRFRFGQLYDGPFKLRAEHPLDADVFVAADVHAGQDDLRLVLDPSIVHGVVFTGTVRDALTHLPITTFHVTPNVHAADGSYLAKPHDITDPRGEFRVAGLEPGTMIVLVNASGYMTHSSGEHDYAEGEYALDADLDPMRTLEVRVVDRRHRPVAARLQFVNADGGLLWVMPGDGIATQYVRTDDRGWATFSNLPATQLVAEVSLSWNDTPMEVPLDLRNPPLEPLEIVLDRCGPVSLRVAALGATPELAASLDLSDPVAAEAALRAAMDAGAAWTLDAPCTVRALAPDGRVFANETLTVARHAPPGGGAPVAAGPASGELNVPEEPQVLEFSADGYLTVTRPWQPAAPAADASAGAAAGAAAGASGGASGAAQATAASAPSDDSPLIAVLLSRR